MLTKQESEAISPHIKHLIAGTTAGIVSTGTLYPLDLIRTRMQVIDDSSGVYRSMIRSTATIIRSEGWKGLYQGLGPAVLAAAGSWGGYFYFYEISKSRKTKLLPNDAQLQSLDHLLSGVEAGVALVLIFNPIWVVKTRLALQGAEKKSSLRPEYTGSMHCIRTIIREEGFKGLYKGLFPALLLTSHGAVQLAVYESLKKISRTYQLAEDRHRQPAWVSVTIGGVSKIIASTITYPYQLVKSRLQQREEIDPITKKALRRYSSTWHCVSTVWRSEGLRGFFRGVVPNSLKVAPSSALTFLVYEEIMILIRQAEASGSSISS